MKKILTLLIVGLFLLQGCDNTLPEELLEQEEFEYIDNQLENEGVTIEYVDDQMENEELNIEQKNDGIQEIPEWFTNDSNIVVESINVSLPDDFQFYTSHYFDYYKRFNEFENESRNDIDCMKYVYNQKNNGDLEKLSEEMQQHQYILKKVMLPGVILTGCIKMSSIKDYPEFIDLSIECGEDYDEDKVGYRMEIKSGEHYACIPVDEKFNVCSIATPILCRQRESDPVKVRKYYDLNDKCPYGYRLYGAGVDGPTDVCRENVRYCDISTCGYNDRNVRRCDLSENLICGFHGQGDRVVELGY